MASTNHSTASSVYYGTRRIAVPGKTNDEIHTAASKVANYVTLVCCEMSSHDGLDESGRSVLEKELSHLARAEEFVTDVGTNKIDDTFWDKKTLREARGGVDAAENSTVAEKPKSVHFDTIISVLSQCTVMSNG